MHWGEGDSARAQTLSGLGSRGIAPSSLEIFGSFFGSVSGVGRTPVHNGTPQDTLGVVFSICHAHKITMSLSGQTSYTPMICLSSIVILHRAAHSDDK